MLNYKVNGDVNGEVIIFVNGAGLGPWMWKNQIEYFNNYKCVTFDLPGHGENRDNSFTTIKDCIKSIKEIIKKESFCKKSIIIGHSVGGQITLEMLSSYPSLFKKGI